MGLTSGGLIALLSVLTIVALAGTVWVWPRLTTGGIGFLAMRAGVLLGGQTLIVLLLLVIVNAYYQFYGNWNDLMGAAGGKTTIHQHPQTRPNAAATTQVTRTITAKLGPGHGARPSRDGQLQHLEIHGVRTGLSGDAYVYLPPEYFKKEFAAKRFPVVMMIAGYPSVDHLTWIDKGHVPDEAAKQLSAGQIQPMIYVMMRPTVEPGWDTECADVPGGPKVESFFAQDVPDAVQGAYRTAQARKGWGIAGYSTGGYCATKIAMLHSDRFSAAASMAGHFNAILDRTTRNLYDGSADLRRDNNLTWRLKNLPQPPISVLVASASIGEKTYPSAVQFMKQARPPLIVDEKLLPTGGHNFKTFRKYIPPVIHWMSTHLQGE